MIIGFEIPGTPTPKGRPRHGKGFTYTPAKTVQAEAAIARRAREFFTEPLVGPVHVDIVCAFKPAKSWSKKKTAEHLGEPHIQRPDHDNLSKLVCDALNGIAYHDDSQVAKATVEKVWASTERTIISIYPIRETWKQVADAAQMTIDEILSQSIKRAAE